MPKYKVQKSPLKKSDFEIIEANRFVERGSYTVFSKDDGEEIVIPTNLISRIETID